MTLRVETVIYFSLSMKLAKDFVFLRVPSWMFILNIKYRAAKAR